MGPRVVSKASYFDFKRDSLYGDERMKFLILKDTNSSSGLKLFKTLLKNVCNTGKNVVIICLDGPIEYFTGGLEINMEKIEILDLFKDSSNWNNEFHFDDYLEKYKDFEGTLCIYSLTSLLIQMGVDKLYSIFNRLMSGNAKLQILSLLHSDVHTDVENDILDSLATAVINNSSDESDNRFMITISTKNKSFGQIWYEYQLTPCFKFDKVESFSPKCGKAPFKKPDPTANLTFNLNLNEEEKEIRSQLQLPYTKTQTNESITTQDLEDDLFDEEDPDDDLDI